MKIALPIVGIILAATALPVAAADHDHFIVASDVSTQYGDSVTLVAQLLEPDEDCWWNVCPVSGRQVDFYVDGEFVGTDVTNSGGYAYLLIESAQEWHVGEHEVRAQYDRHHTTVPATDLAILTITPETTLVTAHDGYFEAALTDDDNEPLVGFPVRFSVMTAAGEQDVCTAFTDATGLARCSGQVGGGVSWLDPDAEYLATYDGSDDYAMSGDVGTLV